MKNYTNSEINSVIYDNMDALMVVSSKEDHYRAIKRSETMMSYIEEEGSYKELIEKLMFHLNESGERITDDYQVFLPKMSEFKGRYSRKITMDIDGVKHTMQMLVYPFEESDADYVILLCDLDQSETERNKKTESKVKAMQETYLFSMYVDLNKDSVSGINVSEISNDDMHYDVKYTEWRMMIVNMIWPDDQEQFLTKTDPEYLKSNLKPTKTFSFDCQMKNLEGEYIWVKLIFGRTETTSESDFRFVFMVENIHENAIALINEVKKFEDLASHDALTGVFNHGRIETELSNAIDEMRNKDRTVSLMMFDIDHFKKINDSFGHAVGDEVLKEFVNVIREQLQEYNIVLGRWGGEEFVCVCYDINIDAVKDIAEKVREVIESRAFETIGAMTCSVGLANVNINDTVKDAFIRLDEALYDAKSGGRNCVKVHLS